MQAPCSLILVRKSPPGKDTENQNIPRIGASDREGEAEAQGRRREPQTGNPPRYLQGPDNILREAEGGVKGCSKWC